MINLDIADKMINSLGNIYKKNILEIGPGKGVLTKKLIKKHPQKLVSIEIDNHLYENLKYLQNENVILLNQDAMHVQEKHLFDNKFIIISNLPYNIGTTLLLKWLKNLTPIEEITIMLQQEVAERIVAAVGTPSYSRISVISQFLCNCEILFSVSPENFYPQPKVFSSVIKLRPKTPNPDPNKIMNLEKVTKEIFTFKRKKIKTILKTITKNKNITPQYILEKTNINGEKRPQELLIDDFYKISCILL